LSLRAITVVFASSIMRTSALIKIYAGVEPDPMSRGPCSSDDPLWMIRRRIAELDLAWLRVLFGSISPPGAFKSAFNLSEPSFQRTAFLAP
jgi:hypothetical protein